MHPLLASQDWGMGGGGGWGGFGVLEQPQGGVDMEAPPVSCEQGEASDSWCCTNPAISNKRNIKACLMFKGFTLLSTVTNNKVEFLSICGQAYVKVGDKVSQGHLKG